MRFKIICIIAIMSFIAGYIFFNKKYISNKAQTFVVGMTSGYAPFVSVNEHGEYEGFDIDVAQALAQAMGKKLVLKDLGSMTSLIIALEQGSIDAIIWGMSITQSRIQKFEMIRYQGDDTTTNPLVFWKEIPSDIKTLNDIKGLTICVEPTSSQSDILAKYPNIVLLSTEKVDDALLNIQYGKAAAAFLDPEIAKKFKNKCPEIQILNITLAPEDQIQGVGITIKKDNKSLTDQVQEATTQLKNNGIIQEYEQKWGLS